MTVEGITEAHVARAVLSRLIESHDAAAAALIRVLGPVRFLKVIQGEEKISSAQEENAAALMAEETSLRWRGSAEAFPRWRSRLPTPSGQQELAAIHQLGGGLLIPETPGWPDALGDLGLGAPLALWYLGNDQWVRCFPATGGCLAVVGSRDSTGYGRMASQLIAGGAAEAGITIISGGAYGIDAVAHRAALAASNLQPEEARAPAVPLPTVAVMAGGWIAGIRRGTKTCCG